MKKRVLQTLSLLLAVHILFLSLDVNVNIHYCSEEHHASTSFGDASRLCHHCFGHHHSHHEAEAGRHDIAEPLHFEGKCCCEDYEGVIHLPELSSPNDDQQIRPILTSVFLPLHTANLSLSSFDEPLDCLQPHRVFHLFTGRLKTIFFSQLKLNPSVF